MNLTFTVKVKHFLVKYMLKEIQAADILSRFASTSTASAVGLLECFNLGKNHIAITILVVYCIYYILNCPNPEHRNVLDTSQRGVMWCYMANLKNIPLILLK